MKSRNMFTEVFQSSHEISLEDSQLPNTFQRPFPIKLHDMLEEMATVGCESIISWQPHGKAFRVHQPEVFARTVMPRYFNKQTKYKSFQRQLHIYNFHRIGKGSTDTGAYFHSMFIRDKKSMCRRMLCQKIKGKKSKSNAVDHAAGDPAYFYSSETNVRGNLTNTLQSDPKLQACTTATKEKKRECSKRGPARTVFTAGSSDRHPEKKPLLNSSPTFDQLVTGNPSPPHQFNDLMDSSEEDEEGACLASEKVHDVSALLCGVNHQKHGDEGFFAGKRFFDVETKAPLIEAFSAVRGGTMLPIFYMPTRSA